MENKLNAIDFRFFIGCPCYIVTDNQNIPTTIDGIDINSNTIVCDEKAIIPLKIIPSAIKPILRKFDNLSRHEVEGLNKLWPSENIKRTTFESIQLDANIVNYLTSLHVDVFGWIDKGLAIDAAYNSTDSKK